MKKALIFPLCAVMASTALSSCSVKPSETAETTAQPTTAAEETTVAPITFASTEDSANNGEEYDFIALKKKSEEIRSAFDKLLNKEHFSGAVYMTLGSDFEYLNTSGDAGTHISNSINTCFYVGSLTKPVTATAVMMLAEQDKLSLDDTIDKYFPSYKAGKSITVRQLLDMTSGIKNYIVRGGRSTVIQPELRKKLVIGNKGTENKKAILDWIMKQEPDFEAGKSFCYSDSNYYLLGEIVSKASGLSYSKFVSESIFKPLGMSGSSFGTSNGIAYPVYSDGDAIINAYNSAGLSSLGMVSSLSDLMKFVDGFLNGSLIGNESLDEMLAPNDFGFGLGFYTDSRSVTSTGMTEGHKSLLTFRRDKSSVLIILSNNSLNDPPYLRGMFRKNLSKYYKA